MQVFFRFQPLQNAATSAKYVSGERFDAVADGYYNLGINDITPDGHIETAFFVLLMKKALKMTIQEHLEHNDALAHDLRFSAFN
jgi:hypothetical protein